MVTKMKQIAKSEQSLQKPQTTGEVVRLIESAFQSIDTANMVSSSELRDALRAKLNGRFDFIAASFTGHNQGAFHVAADNINWCGSHCRGKVISIERL